MPSGFSFSCHEIAVSLSASLLRLWKLGGLGQRAGDLNLGSALPAVIPEMCQDLVLRAGSGTLLPEVEPRD